MLIVTCTKSYRLKKSDCDAFILIDSTNNTTAEKDSGTNECVRGYDLIDNVKEAIKVVCPLTVSCADIVALATRDVVPLSGGPTYGVPTGRLDGLVSNNEVNIPPPTFPVKVLSQFFMTKGITTEEMVALLGAVPSVLRKPDPTMDPTLDAKLVKLCKSNVDGATFLDQNTSFVIDQEIYKQILLKRVVWDLQFEN
ncbi:peroxidase family protein [Medicago truncatula]|uniref:peroxidase n=1 Tax=Medicago truncatula TaxID=3880 RepID=G7L1L0_MEDTR|nr:peroxidase family protein [Medicago truncatula]